MKHNRRRRKVEPQHEKESIAPEMHSDVTRRRFLATAAAGGAAVLAGGLTSFFESSASAAKKAAHTTLAAAHSTSFIEKTIPQLQAMMAAGQLTSRNLTQGYIQRTADLNPLLHAVIEINPQAVAIASQLDNERRAGHVRGPLHGIPLLLKDNIATDDNMQ